MDSMLEYKEGREGRSTLVSRNITVLGRRTSVRLEPEMWNALKEISKREGCKIHDICSLIQLRKNPNTSLTAAIRVFLMLYYRASSTDDGHRRAGHGNFESMARRARVTPDMMRVPAGGGARRLQNPPYDGAGFEQKPGQGGEAAMAAAQV